MVEVIDDEDGEEDFGGYEPEYHPEADEAGDLWCPLCGAVVYADASQCPKCGEYITPGRPPAGPGITRKSKFMYGVLLLLVGIAILALILNLLPV